MLEPCALKLRTFQDNGVDSGPPLVQHELINFAEVDLRLVSTASAYEIFANDLQMVIFSIIEKSPRSKPVKT